MKFCSVYHRGIPRLYSCEYVPTYFGSLNLYSRVPWQKTAHKFTVICLYTKILYTKIFINRWFQGSIVVGASSNNAHQCQNWRTLLTGAINFWAFCPELLADGESEERRGIAQHDSAVFRLWRKQESHFVNDHFYHKYVQISFYDLVIPRHAVRSSRMSPWFSNVLLFVFSYLWMSWLFMKWEECCRLRLLLSAAAGGDGPMAAVYL